MSTSDAAWPNVAYDYRGAQVLVTGGSHGIGRGIAAAYRTAGADVVITGTRPSAGDYEHDLSGYRYLQLELTDNDQIQAVADALPELDILINNAGGNFAAQNEYDPAIFEKSVQVNLLSAYRLAHACHDKLARSSLPGGASVIGLASMTSYFAVEVVPGYGAAKAGIVQMTKTLALAWAKDGIRVNCLAPTAATRMTEGLMPAAVLEKLAPEAVTPGLIHLVSADAPTRAILCAGAGTFERAYITLTQGVHIGTGADAAEQVAARFAEISEREGEIVPDNGSAQGSNEVGKAMRAL